MNKIFKTGLRPWEKIKPYNRACGAMEMHPYSRFAGLPPKGETTHYILRVAGAPSKCVRCASTGKRLTCHPIQGENRTSLCFPVEVCSTMLSTHSPTSEAGGKVVAEPPKGVPLFHRPPGRLPGFIIMAPLYYFKDAHQGLRPRRVSGHMPLCRAAAGPFF